MYGRVIIVAVALLSVGCYPNAVGQDSSFGRATNQPLSLAMLPTIWPGKYKVDPYISVAARLQSEGTNAAFSELLTVSSQCKGPDEEKLAVLCRMLFVQRAGLAARRPPIGGPSFYCSEPFSFATNSGSKAKWPLDPIEIVDGMPFVVVTGYIYQGYWDPHGMNAYVLYCEQNCDWTTNQFVLKTKEEKLKALNKLAKSPKWGSCAGSDAQSFLIQQIE